MPQNGDVVWIVGRIDPDDYRRWQIMGVYLTEAEATRSCRLQYDFIGPMILGKALPEKMLEWEGAVYPLWEDACAASPSA